MAANDDPDCNGDIMESINTQAPQLTAVLREMKEGLDSVRSKIEILISQVRANHFPTADGISYLQAKHLLLISYCQHLVYYMIRKARGISVDGHPVLRNLVEIRLFLEKVRPIDKKLEYQIQKLIRNAASATTAVESDTMKSGLLQKSEDPLKYRPNPDMLVPKNKEELDNGSEVYRPPKIAPTMMEDDRLTRVERDAKRREKQALRQSKRGYVKEIINNLEGRPEEIAEDYGNDNRELEHYRNQWEERARREEELFTRMPLTKLEKKRQKQLQKSRNGLLGLTDEFYDEIKGLPLEENPEEQRTSKTTIGRLKKRKRQ